MKPTKVLARPRAVALSISLIGALGLATGVAAPILGATSATAAVKPAAVVRNVCAKSAIDVPSCGVLWGNFTPSENYAPLEKSIGRQFDIVKNYTDWAAGVTFPNAVTKALTTDGSRTLYYSWNAVNYNTRAKINYQSIANGAWDQSVILPEARALIAYHQKIFIDFNHEFDNSVQESGQGTAAQYAAAYRHIHQVFVSAGVTNVIWVWVTTGYVPHAAAITAGYPGAAYVDWVGYDPYNFDQCHSGKWLMPYQVFQPFYAWLQSQPAMSAKPIMLTEYASAPGASIGAWYAAVAPALQQLPRIKALIQWNAMASATCDYRLTNSASAVAGFKTSANAPSVTGA